MLFLSYFANMSALTRASYRFAIGVLISAELTRISVGKCPIFRGLQSLGYTAGYERIRESAGSEKQSQWQ